MRSYNLTTDVQEIENPFICFWIQALASILASDHSKTDTADSTKVQKPDPSIIGQEQIDALSGKAKEGINLNSLGVAYDAITGSYRPDSAALASQLKDAFGGGTENQVNSNKAATADAAKVANAETKPQDTGFFSKLTDAILNSDKETSQSLSFLSNFFGK